MSVEAFVETGEPDPSSMDLSHNFERIVALLLRWYRDKVYLFFLGIQLRLLGTG